MKHQEVPAQLRGGLTTGTCAAAAAKAALLLLRENQNPAEVAITLPDNSIETVTIAKCTQTDNTCAYAWVQKDSGDDPDVTNGMFIVCEVRLHPENGDVHFCAGEGVGTVTKPGLQIPPGEPAINPAPRAMITKAVREVESALKVVVTVSIPGGRERAAHTFNPKLGVEGGLSILGTSGRIVPRSEDAWFRSLLPQLDMAKALGHKTIFVTPGSFGMELRKHFAEVSDDAVIHAGNFIGDVLLECGKRGFSRIVLAGHAGKIVKIAAGILNTHSKLGDARLETIAAHAALCGASPVTVAEIMAAPTAEAAVEILGDTKLDETWKSIAEKASMRATAHAGIPVDCVITGYGDNILGWNKSLDNIFEKNRRPSIHSIHVVGVGPGMSEWISPAAWQVIRTAEVIVGGKRQLELVAGLDKEKIPLTADLGELVKILRNHCAPSIVILASGDPTCYGILDFVKREFPHRVGSVIPAVGSFQMALARLQKSWNEVAFASAHGRSPESIFSLLDSKTAVLTLTDSTNSPAAIAKAVSAYRAGDEFTFVVLERLGYQTENVTTFTTNSIPNETFDALCVMLIEKKIGGVA